MMKDCVVMADDGLVLREATLDDAELLLDWRNDPETRAASFTLEPVPLDKHLAWLKKTLRGPVRLRVAEDNGVPVGTVRWEPNEDEAPELSWTVAPSARGRGVGKRMLKKAVEAFRRPLTARIKSENIASIRIAEAVGFCLDSEHEGRQLWRLG